jgi:hypothetical protein
MQIFGEFSIAGPWTAWNRAMERPAVGRERVPGRSEHCLPDHLAV